MSEDARFEDADESPLRLRALDADDLTVVSAAVQDSVFPITEMRWSKRKRRFALLLNRFRWEHASDGQPPERVRSILAVEDVDRVSSQGIDRSETDTVCSLLSIAWEPGEDGTGRVVLVLAGDGAVAIDVEALEVSLTDVTRPYRAVSGRVPHHRE